MARMYARHSFVDEAAVANVEDVLRIDAGLSWPTLQLELDYEPRLTIVDIFGSGSSPVLWLHSGGARLSWRHPRYTLQLTQAGTWGEPEFTQLATVASSQAAPVQTTTIQGTGNQPPPQVAGGTTASAPNLLPNAQTIHIASEETAVDLNVLLARRWHSDTRASYGFSGGADDLARMFWPRQRRAELDSSVGFNWSRRDQLSTVLTGARVEVSNGYQHWLTSASEAWETRWSATTGSRLGLGVAFRDSTAPDGNERRALESDWLGGSDACGVVERCPRASAIRARICARYKRAARHAPESPASHSRRRCDQRPRERRSDAGGDPRRSPRIRRTPRACSASPSPSITS